MSRMRAPARKRMAGTTSARWRIQTWWVTRPVTASARRRSSPVMGRTAAHTSATAVHVTVAPPPPSSLRLGALEGEAVAQRADGRRGS